MARPKCVSARQYLAQENIKKLNFYSNILPKGIKSAFTWKSVISMVKSVKKGNYIGYGRSHKVERDSVIATIATGYADGLNRLLSNKGFVMINGHKAPIVGKICMDQTLVDVTGIPNVTQGMHAILLGESGKLTYNADDMARDLNTINYEIVCGISPRVPRIILE